MKVMKQQFTILPMLSYDELTVLCSALAAQVEQDRQILTVAESQTFTELAIERIKIGRSLLTACLEAREKTERGSGRQLEPLRVVWEQLETRRAAWRSM